MGDSMESLGGELELDEDRKDKAIMSWSDLNCSYSTKKGRNDVKTLSSVTGHVNYKELVAIMGVSNKPSLPFFWQYTHVCVLAYQPFTSG